MKYDFSMNEETHNLINITAQLKKINNTEVIRLGIALYSLSVQKLHDTKNKLCITDENDQIIMEFKL